MKIDSSVKSVGTTASGVKRAPQPSVPSSSASTADTVQISSGLQDVESALSTTPEINAERVSEIKQAIAAGKFQINPERIADGLLSSARQMLTASR